MNTWKNSAFVSNIWLISSIYESPVILELSCIALIPLSSGFLSMLIKIHDWSVTPKTQLFSFVTTIAWILLSSLIFCSNSIGILISWILLLSNVIDVMVSCDILLSMSNCADSWNVDKLISCEYTEFTEIPVILINIIIIIIFNMIVTFDHRILNLLLFSFSAF